jgi:hypothetical protein
VEIEEQSSTNIYEKATNLIRKLEINTEVIVVKPNLPIRICTTAIPYSNLQDAHIIMVEKRMKIISQMISFFFRFIILEC